VDFDENRLHPVIHKSRENGVLFDVGHGQGSFSWKVSLVGISSVTN
jgi:predicted amidohydrolase